MALTREYKKTVVARIQRDKKFARALYAGALNALFEGETEAGLSMLRDLVDAKTSMPTKRQWAGALQDASRGQGASLRARRRGESERVR
jgi:hypothetical protein